LNLPSESLSAFEKMIFESSPCLMAVFDMSGKTLMLNQAFSNIQGPSMDSYIGKRLDQIFPDNSSLLQLSDNMSSALNGSTVSSQIYFTDHDDKEIVFLSKIFPLLDDNENLKTFGFVAFDITEYHESRQSLEKTKADLALSQQLAGMGSWEWNLRNQQLSWSDETFNITGVERDVVPTNELFIQLIHPDDREFVGGRLEQAVTEGRFDEMEYRMIRPDGVQINIRVIPSLETDMENQPLRLFGIIHDITEQKKATEEKLNMEKTLQLSQRMESLGLLTSGITHDFNNVLSCISGYTSLARSSSDKENKKLQDAIAQIREGCDRGRDMLDQLLMFARQGHIEVTDQSIANLTSSAVKLVSGLMPSSIQIQTHLNDNIPNVSVDATQLSQIIINLCVNAKDAMNNRGVIDISLTYEDEFEGVCSSCHKALEQNYVVLSVKDQGAGMTEESLVRIFEPFYTSKPPGQGTGMGLAMIHGAMHQHNGHVIVKSLPEEGSEFKLYFPVGNE